MKDRAKLLKLSSVLLLTAAAIWIAVAAIQIEHARRIGASLIASYFSLAPAAGFLLAALLMWIASKKQRKTSNEGF